MERKKKKGTLFETPHSLQSLIAAERGGVLVDCSASGDTGPMLQKVRLCKMHRLIIIVTLTLPQNTKQNQTGRGKWNECGPR